MIPAVLRPGLLSLSVLLALSLVACEASPLPKSRKLPAGEVREEWSEPFDPPPVKFDVGAPAVAAKGPKPGRPEISERPVSVTHGKCAEPVKGKPDAPVEMKGSATKDGKLRLEVSNFRSHCEPKPQFAGGVVADGVIVSEVAPAPDTPVSKCSCFHDLVIEMQQVPPGAHDVRLFSRLSGDGDPIPVAKVALKVPGTPPQ